MVHRASGFKQAPIAKMEAIQRAFAIDADGVLQDEHIGNASIEGKLKMLIGHAHESQVAENPGQ
jgi:hypothetical protein